MNVDELARHIKATEESYQKAALAAVPAMQQAADAIREAAMIAAKAELEFLQGLGVIAPMDKEGE